MRSWAKCRPQIGETHRWTQRITTEPPRGPVLGQGSLTCNGQSAGGPVWTSVDPQRVKTPGGPGHRGPNFCEFCLQQLDLLLTVNVWEKNIVLLTEERKNEQFWNMLEHSVLKKSALRRNYFTRTWCAKVWSGTHLPVGTPAHFSHPALPTWRTQSTRDVL